MFNPDGPPKLSKAFVQQDFHDSLPGIPPISANLNGHCADNPPGLCPISQACFTQLNALCHAELVIGLDRMEPTTVLGGYIHLHQT
jgi:hypothetical protein